MESAGCPQLPLEIWSAIAGEYCIARTEPELIFPAELFISREDPLWPLAHFERTPELAALARVNWTMNRLATPYLYRAICLSSSVITSAFFAGIATLVNPWSQHPVELQKIKSVSHERYAETHIR